MNTYHAMQRVKGKKWLTVATLNVVPKGCLASAVHILSHKVSELDAGNLEHSFDYVSRDDVMGQKNWSGYADDCLHVSMSQDEQDDLLEILHIERMKQIKDDMEYYLHINQDDPAFCAKIKARWND